MLVLSIQFFDAVAWPTRRASSCKKSATTIPQSLRLGTCLTRIVKNGLIKQKMKIIIIIIIMIIMFGMATSGSVV